jgi:hypothetical protein
VKKHIVKFSTLSLALLLPLIACNKDAVDDSADDTGGLVGDCELINGVEVCVLTGILTQDMTLTADKTYLLRGGFFVGDDEGETTLTIEPGTTVYGETSTQGMLVVTRNSKLMAEGTAEAPIVFTSSNAPGTRAPGDWGGLILNGKAPLNVCDGVDDAPDPCEAFGEGGTGTYGGNDAEDSSGSLKYVRVEFGGTLLSPENELNGIAFQGVGSGTVVDYIQVHKNDDDGVEFFGGTVRATHLLVSGVGDDSLDWTDGWQGSAQYVILQQDGAGDNGIEADNNGDNNDASPRSNPSVSNVTLIGAPDSEQSDFGLLLREGTAADLDSVLVQGFNDACLALNHDATYQQSLDGALSITNMIGSCATPVESDAQADSLDFDGSDVQAWLEGLEGNSFVSEALVEDGYSLTAPNFMPTAAAQGQGAITDGVDWTAGWTDFPQN